MDMRSTRSASSSRKAMSAKMGRQKAVRRKSEELVKQQKGCFSFVTCDNTRHHSGHDGGVCATVYPSKDTEQEAIFSHRIDHPRHRKHRAQKAEKDNAQ